MSQDKILLKNIAIIDPRSSYNGKEVDVLIEKKIIVEIGEIDSEDAELLDCKGCYVSPGWMDMRVNFCEPGDEHKETLKTGSLAAIAGGFTAVGIMPNLNPVTDHKSQIEYIANRGQSNIIKLYPYGTLSLNAEGKELAELYDMHSGGAVAFTDGGATDTKSGLLLRALQYCQPFQARILVHCEDKSLSAGGRMHEGEISVTLGLKGIPPLAESVAIARDLEILRYTGGRIHISRVSTAQGVALIKKAKSEGLDVTADVSIHHLVLGDEALTGFDTNYKMRPPLRSADHRAALIAGINDGTIDCIVSDHTPENIEHKAVEFEYAHVGAIGTQILFSLYQTHLSQQISLEQFVTCVSINPREALGIQLPLIELEEAAELTIFDTEATYIFDKKINHSLSDNSPFLGESLRGKVLRTIL